VTPHRDRRRNRDEDENSKAGAPAWMVTYSDMVTLLLCFFVLLYSFSTVDLQKFRLIMESFRGTFGVLTGGHTISPEPSIQTPPVDFEAELEQARMELQQLQAVYRELNTMFRSEGIDGSVTVEFEPGRGVVVRFAEQVLFDLGRALIKTEAKGLLTKVADILKDIPNQIRVEGHTDDLPIRTAKYPSNWELSTNRATNVIRYLIESQGFSPERLSAAGYGEYRPVASNDTPEGRAKNRRVDLVIMSTDLGETRPGVLSSPTG